MSTDSFGTFLRTLERLRAPSDEDDEGGVATAQSWGEDAASPALALILSYLAQHGHTSRSDLGAQLRLARQDLDKALDVLRTVGLVEVSESGDNSVDLTAPLRKALTTR